MPSGNNIEQSFSTYYRIIDISKHTYVNLRIFQIKMNFKIFIAKKLWQMTDRSILNEQNEGGFVGGGFLK